MDQHITFRGAKPHLEVPRRHFGRSHIDPLPYGVIPSENATDVCLIGTDYGRYLGLRETGRCQLMDPLNHFRSLGTIASLLPSALYAPAITYAVALMDLLPLGHSMQITQVTGGCHHPAP